MNIDSIQNGIVIDHITAGYGMKLYELLHLDNVDASVAIIKNATSKKIGKKDIIKIDADISIDLDVIGYVDPQATVNIIKNGVKVNKYSIEMPRQLTDVIKCKNPRCITQTEQELKHIFHLTDEKKGIYRCIYCETQADKNG